MLAICQARRGDAEGARRLLEPVLAGDQGTMSSTARRVIAQEVEGYAPLRDIALTLYRAVIEDKDAQSRYFLYDVAWPLGALYRRTGRDLDARDAFLRRAKDKGDQYPREDQSKYLGILNQNTVAERLIDLGYPADAAVLYDRVLGDPTSLQSRRVAPVAPPGGRPARRPPARRGPAGPGPLAGRPRMPEA
jgi:hypothetical protein